MNHFFSLWLKLSSVCCFPERNFWRDQISQFENDTFPKKIINGRFGFVSTLLKKVFSGAPVKCFSLYGSNNSDSAVFEYVAFGEIKYHNLRTTPFQKKNCYGSFRYVSTLH